MDGVAGDVHAKEPRGGVEGAHGVEDEVAEAVEDGPTLDPLRRLRGVRMVTHEAVGSGGDEAAGGYALATGGQGVVLQTPVEHGHDDGLRLATTEAGDAHGEGVDGTFADAGSVGQVGPVL